MTRSEVKIDIDTSPSAEDERVVSEGLRRYDGERAVSGGYAEFAVFLRASSGDVLGGLLAEAGRGWLHIKTLWLDPSVRRGGHGSRLVAAAEGEARRRGCHGAYLDTFDYQARPFYERCGYEVFGTLDDYPVGHQRFFMRKTLGPVRSETSP
jgi:GNAT superfamily N-acetyltransferase